MEETLTVCSMPKPNDTSGARIVRSSEFNFCEKYLILPRLPMSSGVGTFSSPQHNCVPSIHCFLSCKTAFLHQSCILFEPVENDLVIASKNRKGLSLAGGISCVFSSRHFLHRSLVPWAILRTFFPYIREERPYVFVLILLNIFSPPVSSS